MPIMSVVHTHYQGSGYVPSHQKGAALASLSLGVNRANGVSWPCNPRDVPQQGLAHGQSVESIPSLHPSVSFPVHSDSIISRRQCRRPWSNRKQPQQYAAASRLSQLGREMEENYMKTLNIQNQQNIVYHENMQNSWMRRYHK